ncbi:carboxypeptidase regulatory-like domain-containing protein [Clostridium sp. PL3]|uniref:Carboxypeptidase regulatory-like domain-containing protein n=1 Tax=Clostridium thailandense TaxID=2794346 RepID=A0A949TNY0_9CLOT|nr:carboxypeptidase-like regulatory domain-containing protein [Clostridium thailandense]MBV7273917.1 carboxypeptidase regulatory-like domain-containing protein [Clostridium thailandense]
MNGNVATLTLPAVNPTDVDQNITYSISYLGGQVNTAQTTVNAALSSGIAGFITDGGTAVKDAVVTINGKTATTNADGYYVVNDVEAGTYDVTIAAQGYPVTTVSGVKVDANNLTALSQGITALVKANITATGVVADKTTGAPISGGAVTLEYNNPTTGWTAVALAPAVTTSAAGAFTLNQATATPDMEFGGQYRLTVKATGYHDTVVNFTTKSDDVANVLAGIEMEAIKPISITGVAKDSTGAVINAGTVTLSDADGNTLGTATTGADGAYSFTNQALLSGKYTLTLDNSTDAVYSSTIDVTEGTDVTNDINLVGGYNVSLTVGTEAVGGVFSAAGSDADTATYTATLLNGNTVVATKPLTASAGDDSELSFTLNRVAPGTYTLRVSGNYVTTKDFSVTVTNTNATVSGRTTTAGYITGVVDDGSANVAGATVELLDSNNNVVATTTSANTTGVYDFAGVAAGNYKVRVSKDGFVTKTSAAAFAVANETDATENVTLAALPTTGAVAGFVRADSTLTPAAGAVVTYYNEDGTSAYTATVAADGSYSIASITPGTYKVVVRDPSALETYVTSQTVAAGDAITNANYKLTAGGNETLTIKLTDKNSQAVNVNAGDVKLYDVNAAQGTAAAEADGYWVNAGASDTITFNTLSKGTYELKIDAPSSYVDVDQTVTVTSATQQLPIQLVDAASVYSVNFRLVDADNTDGDAADIVVFKADGTKLATTTTAADGTATIANLANGTYKFYIFKNGNLVTTKDVTVNGANVSVPVIQLATAN